jgi:ADP-ribosylglycohydrolase
LIGAIAGDVIGSIYEGSGFKGKLFPLFDPHSRFTDDTVLTVAVADILLHGGDYAAKFREYYSRYPNSGFGLMFHGWVRSDRPKPYGSFGNGSAMRVSPVAFAFDDMDQVLLEAKRSAEVTHDHPEGIKGAQAAAAAVLLARKGSSKDDIRAHIEKSFGYDLSATLDAIRPDYDFDETCQGTVPAALISFFESMDFEDAVRNAISLGGDSDTLACITGAIAHAFYGGVPPQIAEQVFSRLDPPLKAVVEEFTAKYL